MMKKLFAACILSLVALGGMHVAEGRNPRGSIAAIGGGGATQIFNFANFAGSPNIHLGAGGAAVSGGTINFPDTSHAGGGAWYGSGVENIQAFTTDFTFVLPGDPSGATYGNYGLVFVIQNSNNTTNSFAFGINAGGNSANGIGWGAGGGSVQPAMGNSIGVVFNISQFNEKSWSVGPRPASAIGLYVDGGPPIGSGGGFISTDPNGYAAQVDVRSFGPNFGSGNLIHAFVTYDGTILTVVATDTVTAATTRISWPVNIPAIVGANTAFIGFCQSQPDGTSSQTTVNSWAWSQGINSRLATPTFSVTPGQYTGTQTVSLSGPAGASIYYTTNGTPPTTASTLYAGTPISVTASEVVSAVAVESSFSDSIVAQGLYLIQSGATPVVNFPSGFASTGGLIQTVGNATVSGSNVVFTDTVNFGEAAAAWFDVPVSIGTFSTSFTLNTSSVGGSQNGFCFVLQDYPQTTTGTNFNWNLGNGPFGVTGVSGGPWTLSSIGPNFGYTYIFNSIGVCFDLNGNSVGLYTNGAPPTGSQTAITGGVSLTTATAINTTIAYNGTALTIAMTQGANTFNLTLNSSINIPSIVGASIAWPGFTAASAAFTKANMNVSKWTMYMLPAFALSRGRGRRRRRQVARKQLLRSNSL